MIARGLAIAAVLATAGSPRLARADEPLRPEQIPQRARELVDRGRAAHDAGNYTAAIAAFKEAYVLAPSPGLLFNLAQAYRLAGNCDEAAWMYRRFLDTNPSPDRRTIAESHLQSVEKCGHGGLRLIPTPAPSLEAKAPDVPAETKLAIDDTPRTTETPGARQKRIALWTGIGGGLALAGAAYFAYDAYDASSTVSDTYKKGGKWSDVASTDARGQRSATYATVLGVGGGLAVASSAVLYAVGRHYESANHVAVSPTKTGAEVSLTWGF